MATRISGQAASRQNRARPRTVLGERGTAVPLAFFVLVILLSLSVAFGALSGSEPLIAANHVLSAQARAAADSGLQAVLAAFSHTQHLPADFATTLALAPFVALPGVNAGYKIAVDVDAAGSVAQKANERVVTVVGYAPNDVSPNRAVRALQAVIQRDSLMATINPPAGMALPAGGSVKGEVDARSTAGNWCRAGPPTAAVIADGRHRISTSGSMWGPANDAANENGPDVWHANSTPPPGDFVFANLAFSVHELAALRALAAAHGTLFTAASSVVRFPRPAGGGQGAGSSLPDGVVYVEGNAEIEVHDVTWRGWLIVVPSGSSPGALTFSCFTGCDGARLSMTLNGLVYASDAINVETAASDRQLMITGAVVAMQSGSAPSTINPRTTGDFRVNYDCAVVRSAITGTPTTTGVGLGRQGWYLKEGSYREVSAL